MGEQHSTEVAFVLLTQLPWVQFLVIPKIYFRPSIIERHCLASEQCHSNEPIWQKAGMRKSIWGLRQASTTKKSWSISLLSAFLVSPCSWSCRISTEPWIATWRAATTLRPSRRPQLPPSRGCRPRRIRRSMKVVKI